MKFYECKRNRARLDISRLLQILIAFGVFAAVPSPSARESRQQAAPWQAYADPREAGFVASQLDEARALADASRSGAVMAIFRGRVVAAWGAVERPLMVHSLRKSLAGALYGMAIDDGRLALSDSLAALGIDDAPALNAAEKQATFGDLIASRSGVYHGAAYADGEQERERPARGTHAPGSHFFYNNWDFNAAETVYERQAGEDLYQAFERRVARVLGMEDFDVAQQFEALEPSRSRMPAHTMRLSARDLARFGQLYLQAGRWNDRQVVPADWIRESWRVRSRTGEKSGYGYLWWIYEPGSLGVAYPTLDRLTVYLARGTGGQAVFVIPEADMVVVHRGDTDNGRTVAGPAIWQIAERLVAAKAAPSQPSPALTAMTSTPLSSTLPPPPPTVLVPIASATRSRVVGRYEIAPGVAARAFEFERRLFMSIPQQGEAELFATGPLSFTIKVQPGVRVTFIATPDGAVKGVEVILGRQVITGRRLPG